MQRTISPVARLCNRRLTAPNVTAKLNQCREKNVSIFSVSRRLGKTGLYSRIFVKKPLLRKQNNIKRFQWAKVHRDWTIEQWNKIVWTDNSKFEIFCPNWSGEEMVKELQPTVSKKNVEHGEGSIRMWEMLPIAKSGICTRWRANWIRPAITAYCSITRFHLKYG